jgi:hypothetical protein
MLTVRVIKLGNLWWVGHVTCMVDSTNLYEMFVEKFYGRR